MVALNHLQELFPIPSILARNANVLNFAAVPARKGTIGDTCQAAANDAVANRAATVESAIATNVMVGIRTLSQIVVATNAPGTFEAFGASVVAHHIALSALIREAVIFTNIFVKRAINARHGRLDFVVRVDFVLGTCLARFVIMDHGDGVALCRKQKKEDGSASPFVESRRKKME